MDTRHYAGTCYRAARRAYCGVAEGDWPRGKAYYRFIDKPDDSAVTISAILQPHRERTIQRMKAQKTVLCIQDGSDLNYSALERVSVMDREADPENEFRTSFLKSLTTNAVIVPV